MHMLDRDTIFTNVAVTARQRALVGRHRRCQARRAHRLAGSRGTTSKRPARPRIRIRASRCQRKQCPSFSPQAEAPQGVPISAIIFGGRRSTLVPLVFEATDWNHGVLVGAAMASETTAAATGAVGVVRRDSMAMKPFCGYNFADYFGALAVEFRRQVASCRSVFHVNWFRKDADGKFLWPGFGDNMRVLEWILERCAGRGAAVETPIGFVPDAATLRLDGLDLDRNTMHALLSIDPRIWQKEIEEIEAYFDTFGNRMPQGLREQARRIKRALDAQLAA
jgi:phosphoenolpyruvate carboxykinase (GTP)